MTIDSIYSKERGHRLSPCIPIGIIRLSVINSLSNLNGSRTISCPDLLLFLFFPPLVAEAGIFIGRDLSPTDFAITRSVNVRIVVAKWEKKGVHVRYVKLECFSVSWIILIDPENGIRTPPLPLFIYAFINFVDPIISLVVSDESNMDSRWKQTIWWVLLKSILIYFIYMDDWNETKTSVGVYL